MRATSSSDEEWSTVWKCYHILYVYFCVMIEMIASVKAGRVVIMRWKWSGLLCIRTKIFVRLLIFRDIAWEDSKDLRETSEIYTLTALWSRLRSILYCYLLTFGKLSMLIRSEVYYIVTYLFSGNWFDRFDSSSDSCACAVVTKTETGIQGCFIVFFVFFKGHLIIKTDTICQNNTSFDLNHLYRSIDVIATGVCVVLCYCEMLSESTL